MIGFLPVPSAMKIEKLDYIYNGGSGGAVPFNARYYDSVRTAAAEPLVAKTMGSSADITAALSQGGIYYGSMQEATAQYGGRQPKAAKSV